MTKLTEQQTKDINASIGTLDGWISIDSSNNMLASPESLVDVQTTLLNLIGKEARYNAK